MASRVARWPAWGHALVLSLSSLLSPYRKWQARSTLTSDCFCGTACPTCKGEFCWSEMFVPRRWSFDVVAGLGLLFLQALVLTLTWRKWVHPVVDYGRELYVPWRLAQGDLLYTEVSHIYGPLSAYFHAGLFQLFGTSYTVQIVSNIVVTSLIVGMAYAFARSFGWRTAAVLNGFLLIVLFSASHYMYVGNFSFMGPYAHETTHGLLLTLVMTFLLGQSLVRAKPGLVFCAGLAYGCIFLTKIEIVLGASITLGAYIVLRLLETRFAAGSWRELAALGLGVVLVPGAFSLWFASTSGESGAAWLVFEPYRYALTPGLTENPFYHRWIGYDRPLLNLLRMAAHAGAVMGAGLLAFESCRRWPGVKHKQMQRLILLAVAAILAGGSLFISPYDIGYSFPLLAFLGALVLFVSLYLRDWDLGHSREDRARLLLWMVLAGAMLPKVVLYSRIHHYGFVLAVPSVIVLVSVGAGWLNELLGRMGGESGLFRGIVMAGCLGIGVHASAVSARYIIEKNMAIGSEADRMWTYGAEVEANLGNLPDAIDWVEKTVGEDESVLVLPEGVIINYLTRRPSGSRFIYYTPAEMLIFGEETVVESLRQSPPDYVMLVDREMSEFGYGAFGSDGYGDRILSWVSEHYEPVVQFGGQPFISDQSGIVGLKRRTY